MAENIPGTDHPPTTEADIINRIFTLVRSAVRVDIVNAPALSVNPSRGTTIDHAAVVVGAAAALISPASAVRRRITIINAETDLVAIGNADVTLNTAVATDGFVLGVSGVANDGTGGSITLETTAAIYGIGAGAASRVQVITESD